MSCTHPERPNVLSLPSAGNPHCCRECFDAQPITPYQGKRESWDHAGYDYATRGADIHYRSTGGWRCENPTDERTWK